MAITIDDFSKIWASTSPLTPYSFSESQYKEGWNFIGGTPPSRQMWDFLQKNNDEKMQYLANNYLPLSGGTLTGVVNGVTPTAGDNSTKIATTEFVNKVAGLPVGFQYFQTNPNVPAGSLPLLGGEYSRETYADLWAWVQTQSGYLLEESAWQAKAAANGGNVPFYSRGDGSTTFRVPALKCWVRGANSINEVGGYLAAGLPNITGSFDLRPVDGGQNVTWETNDGAIKVATKTGDISDCVGRGSSKGPLMDVTIDASRSSSVYGNSTTVQPESIVGMWLVKAYGVIVDTGQIDEQQYIDDRFAAAKDYTDMEVETGVPTGIVQAFAGNTIPNGWLLCDGSAVSRTTYANLYACIGDTYGAGDGTDTFNLPNLTDKFIEGSATSGTEHSAGLPNITGSFHADFIRAEAYQSSGAFTQTVVKSWKLGDGSSGNDICRQDLDASRSNAIYGNSDTVQPPALTMRYIIKY